MLVKERLAVPGGVLPARFARLPAFPKIVGCSFVFLQGVNERLTGRIQSRPGVRGKTAPTRRHVKQPVCSRRRGGEGGLHVLWSEDFSGDGALCLVGVNALLLLAVRR